MAACMTALMPVPMAKMVTPVLVTLAIMTVEVAVGIVVPLTSIAVPIRMIAAAAPITIVIEAIHCVDQRIGHGRTNQQVQRCVTFVVSARTQRNRQAHRKPSSGQPFHAAPGSNGSVIS